MSLALIGNASGRFSQPNPVLPLLPRGIFDKGTRRKTVAVAGAAMEIGARIGLHELGREAGRPDSHKAGRQIDL